jgi:hypothetical protein
MPVSARPICLDGDSEALRTRLCGSAISSEAPARTYATATPESSGRSARSDTGHAYCYGARLGQVLARCCFCLGGAVVDAGVIQSSRCSDSRKATVSLLPSRIPSESVARVRAAPASSCPSSSSTRIAQVTSARTRSRSFQLAALVIGEPLGSLLDSQTRCARCGHERVRAGLSDGQCGRAA